MAIISDDNEIHEDDEAVRCVCGFEDYPGPPPFDDEMRSLGLRDAIDLVAIFTVESENDMTGFFVQCDICKVWEHGLCVGIVSEDSSPDEYYCEVCRKDLHKIYTASNGYVSPFNFPGRSHLPTCCVLAGVIGCGRLDSAVAERLTASDLHTLNILPFLPSLMTKHHGLGFLSISC